MNFRTMTVALAVVGMATVAGCNRDSSGTAPRTSGAQDTSRAVAQTTDDVGVTTRVKTALIAESQLNSRNIDVDTRNGIVTLSGTVPDKGQSDRAAQLAKGIDGVKQVENRLKVGASG
jgi:hyperosmotically inducible protein